MEEVCLIIIFDSTSSAFYFYFICLVLRTAVFLSFLGVFFIPYLVFLFACGIPLFLMETSLGQYTSQGSVTCWRKICPLFEGEFSLFTSNVSVNV